MKTHMQRMHGISIQNGNHIGGVVCDVCNKELCSKYFLRVHKQNSHGIIMDNVMPAACGNPQQRFWPSDAAAAADCNGPAPAPSDEPDGGSGGGHQRYYKHYTEACTVCFRRFRSPKWLSAHLLNDHGDEGRAQWKHVQNHLADDEQHSAATAAAPSSCDGGGGGGGGDSDHNRSAELNMKQYRCSYCPFATSVLSFLFVHEKFHLAGENNVAAAAAADFGTSPANRWSPPVDGDDGDDDDDDGNNDGGNDDDDNDNDADAAAGNEDWPAAVDADGGHDDAAAAAEPEPRHAPPPAAAESVGHEPFIMQSFFLENCSVSPSAAAKTDTTGRSDSFHSSLVYLPVKEKLTSTVNVFFKLTPT